MAGKLVDEVTLDSALAWFRAHGGTDEGYLTASFNRFVQSHSFVSRTLPENPLILDVGAHWLHQAFFFANDGHRLICADVPITMRESLVHRQAGLMGAQLREIGRMELGEGLESLPADSVDAIMFGEIIEHITFNPILMWEAFHRVLKPGGTVYITTPNSMFFESMYARLENLTKRAEYGIPVDEIMSAGTYGHHWKEYSLPELKHYFSVLSDEYTVSDSLLVNNRPDEEVAWRYQNLLMNNTEPLMPEFARMVFRLEDQGAEPFMEQIYIAVNIGAKQKGIKIRPPWVPVY
jgi:SAM-dependent methyltransferase